MALEDGRDGIVSAMLGDLFGEQAPGLSNTAQGQQGAQLAGLTELGGTPPGGLPTGINDTPFGNVSGAPTTFGMSAYASANPGAVYGSPPYDFEDNAVGLGLGANPAAAGIHGSTTSPPAPGVNPFSELPEDLGVPGMGPPVGAPPPQQDPGPQMGPIGSLMNDPEAMTAFASAAPYGGAPPGAPAPSAPGVPSPGQQGIYGENPAMTGLEGFFGELPSFGPDAYGPAAPASPGPAGPYGPGLGPAGPYGEFGGFGPDAYGAYAGVGPEGYGGFGGFGGFGEEGFDGFDGYDGYGDDMGDDADGDDDGDDGDGGDDGDDS